MRRNNTLSKDIMASLTPVAVRRIETRMLVAKMLHDFLSTSGITQKEFASMIGKQPSEVSKWLSGNHNFTIDTLSDIGYYLDADFLLHRDEIANYCCVRFVQIKSSNTKTGDFEIVRVSDLVSAKDYLPNNKRLEKCLA